MSLVGALSKAAKKTAPFYSAVDDALANLKRPKGTGAEFLTEVMKTKGVKKAEIADRKLEEAFKAKGKMTKEEAQQVLKDNPPPKLQEREYNEKMVREEEDIKEELAQEMYGRSYEDLSHRDRRPIFDETQRIMGEENGPQYGDYKTQGGENYREILLKLPTSRPSASNYSDPAKYDADMRAFNASGKADYQSSHWKQDPNVLAHMRVQDRTGPNGEKILHVEEIQSDWHQEGRKKGYKLLPDQTAPIDSEYRALVHKNADARAAGREPDSKDLERAKQLEEELIKSDSSNIPDAPFKKNWHELAMKRLLNYAADQGYDSIAITPGAEQASRYDLSKQISKVDYNKFNSGQNELTAWDKDGKKVFEKYGASQEEVADYIGKEAAEKLFATTPKDNHMGGERYSLIGEELQVGGEGMKGFYDQILPSYLNTFGKPYGAQVGQIGIRDPNAPSSAARYAIVRDADNNYRLQDTHTEQFALPEIYKSSAEAESAIDDKLNRSMKLHNFPITPEMRESIKQKGLPLYQQIGIPTAGAGAASQMPETMQEPVLEPEVKKADGGAINYNTAPDMSDGGRIIQGAPFKHGGKVNMTTNRDAMFMELSNKKLKRK